MKIPISPLSNVGDVSRRVSEFSTFIEGERGGADDAQQVKISEKMTLPHNLCPWLEFLLGFMTTFMFTNCTLVNFSKRRYLKPFRCLDITQVHAKKLRWCHQRGCLGARAPQQFHWASLALEFLKIFIHCRHLHNFYIMFSENVVAF